MSRKRAPARLGTIYLLWAEDSTIFKIGWTAGNVDFRASIIEAYSPLPLRIIAAIPGHMAAERAIHAELHQYRVHGEWFSLPEAVVWALCAVFHSREVAHA